MEVRGRSLIEIEPSIEGSTTQSDGEDEGGTGGFSLSYFNYTVTLLTVEAGASLGKEFGKLESLRCPPHL